jgi:hypothetical protein
MKNPIYYFSMVYTYFPNAFFALLHIKEGKMGGHVALMG